MDAGLVSDTQLIYPFKIAESQKKHAHVPYLIQESQIDQSI
jgi:hypothetical protein